MSNELAFAAARRQSRAALLGTWLDGGTLAIYDGTRPASADTAISTQVLLASFELPDPAGEAEEGVFTGELPDPALFLADGTATWARISDSTDETVCDLDAGVTGSGAGIEMDNVDAVEGATASLTAITITEG